MRILRQTGLRRSLLDSIHVRVFTAGLRPIGLWWNEAGVQSRFWRFYMNDREGAGLGLAGGLYPLEADRLYFVPAGVRFDCRNTTEIMHLYIHFDALGFSRLMMRELFHSPIRLPDGEDLLDRTRRIAPLVPPAGTFNLPLQCRIKSLLFDALAAYLEGVDPEQLGRCSQIAAAQEPVMPAICFIEDHLGERLPNRELAGLCHMSEDYFIRRFRECVGQTPSQYILERRVTQAAQRLLFTDHSIEQIAAETGFGNRFYFTRVFTRQTGLAPAAYRKRARV